MKVLDPGHDYKLAVLDALQPEGLSEGQYQRLTFVKRNSPPEKYPGNVNHHWGTTIQEVCRVLIDRLQYVNKQIRCSEDEVAIRHLRGVIVELEARAAKRHGRKIILRHDVENEPTCKLCGHIQCNETCKKPEGAV